MVTGVSGELRVEFGSSSFATFGWRRAHGRTGKRHASRSADRRFGRHKFWIEFRPASFSRLLLQGLLVLVL